MRRKVSPLTLAIVVLGFCVAIPLYMSGESVTGDGQQQIDATSVGGTAAGDMSTDAERVASTNGNFGQATQAAFSAAVEYTDAATSGISASVSLTGYTMAIDSGDWFGWEPDEGSSANNAVVLRGYSTANATNNSLSGWGGFSQSATLQDIYLYGFIRAPAVATSIGVNGIVILVRSSATGITTNKANILFDDTVNWTNQLNMVSTTDDEWNAYQITLPNLPAAWSNTVPTVTLDGIAQRGLNARINLFTSLTNDIEAKVLVDWD